MSDVLVAIFDGSRVGCLGYTGDRLSFEYDDAWREDRASFPLSISMPLTRRSHGDSVVRSFISGLLLTIYSKADRYNLYYMHFAFSGTCASVNTDAETISSMVAPRERSVIGLAKP